MIKHFIVFFCTFLTLQVTAQYSSGKTFPDHSEPIHADFSDWSFKIASTISQTDLKKHVFTLGADEFQGRETGTKGNDKAAAYIVDHFEKLSLPHIGDNGAYFQSVAFTFTSWEKGILQLGDQKLKLLRDFVAFPQNSTSENLSEAEFLFLGYGIDDEKYSDYRNVDVEGKVVMVFDEEPKDQNGVSLLTGSTSLSEWSTEGKKKSAAAKMHGAALLIIISNDLQTLISENRRKIVNRVTQLGNFISKEQEGVNTLYISSRIAEKVLGDKRQEIIEQRNAVAAGKSRSVNAEISVPVTFESSIKRSVIEGQNVLGFIEGTDKKDEILIVSAHYDHVGTKGEEVYNGADDNASGTTTVLELAEAYATAKRLKQGPRRSILFILLTGEEKGLLGSEYYANNPIFEIENTIANINIDMVGRWGKEYEGSETPYIYVIGSDRLSQDLHDINETINEKHSKLILDYKYNDEKDPNRFYYRSDHYNFAKKGIPAIFFFNGVHGDYHRLTDTPDKIDLEQMQKRARHIFYLSWELANREERIKLISPASAP